MPRRTRVILEGVAPFVIVGLLFGLLHNTLFYPRTPVEYVEAGTIGVLLGAAAGLAEQTSILKRWLQQRSFAGVVIARTAGYSVAVALALSVVLSIEPATLGECSYTDCLVEYIRGPLFIRDLVAATVFTFVAVFSAQAIFLIGMRNFGRLITGRYRRPREIRAEFMFVDIRGSTAIAERLGHVLYSSFLRDFFVDVSRAIHQNRGEVYQYVGDEVVIVWPGRRAAGRWLECFIEMRSSIAGESSRYLGRYGLVPEFKAGVHAGAVVVAEVGTLQRAHVFHGDVLNTAARLESKCNEAGFDLLASEDAVSSLSPGERNRFVLLPPLQLRGRASALQVYALGEARTGEASVRRAAVADDVLRY